MAQWLKVLTSGSNIAVNDITSSGAFDLSGNADVGGTLGVTGAATLSSNLTVAGTTNLNGDVNLGNAASDTIGVSGQFSNSLIPTTNATYSIGSSSNKWQLYGVNSEISGSFSGSFDGSFNGSLSGTLSDGGGISNFSFDGTSNTTISVDVDNNTLDIAGGQVQVATGGIDSNQIADAAVGVDQISSDIAGTGLSGGSGNSLDVEYGSAASEAVEGNTPINISGTGNEVTVSGGSQALGSGPTFTVGLPNDVDISNDLTVGGNLYVQGTTTEVNTANLLVEDKFILLNSGSANPDEGGIVIDEGAGLGHAFVYDSQGGRFGYTGSLDSSATDATPDAFSAAVVDEAAGHTDKAEYQKNGNIRITSAGEVYIYA